MAPGYGQYNSYYDPVGSQATQQQGYNYQSAATSASQPAIAAYSAPTYPSYGSGSYSSQQYGSSGSGQQSGARSHGGASTAATGTGTSGVNGQDSHASASRSNSTQQHDSGSGAWGNLNYLSSSYNASLQPPARSQSNASPLYASSAPSANSSYGRSSYTAPTQQAQSSASSSYAQPSYGQQSGTQSYLASGSTDTSRQTYHGSTQHTQASTEPSRYGSPLHAVQAQQAAQQAQQVQQQQQSRQQTHGRQASRSSNHQPSPVISSRAPARQVNHRQSSASVEPANTTVDPSQVYDSHAEREKKAKAEAEAEKRRKMEEIEAAKKAEEERIAEEKCQAQEAQRQAEEAKRKADEARANEERRAEQAKRKSDEQAASAFTAAKAEAERKKEEQRKARESKNAASTLAAMASSSNIPDPDDLPPPANDEEAEMRAMFQKMREFNAKNPAMLAKLWEEERRSHAVRSQSPQPSAKAQSPAPPKSNAPKRAPSSTALSGNTATPSPMKSVRNAATTASAPAPAPTRPESSRPSAQNLTTEANAPQANTLLWPPGKKGLLAEIAARWLHSVNPQRVVTTTEILDRLDTNPNYVQLCKSLEGMGLRFERAAFARELLRGIPTTSPATANQPSPQASDAAIMSTNGTVAQATGAVVANMDSNAAPGPKRKRATKAEMEQRRSLNLVNTLHKQAKGKANSSGGGMVDYGMPSFSVPDDAAPGSYITHIPGQAPVNDPQASHASPHFAASNGPSRQPSHSVQPDRRSTSVVQQGPPMPVGSAQQTPEVKPPSPVRPPANKEEAARKRGFGDLVDLTAGDSDDDDAPPMKTIKNAQFQRPGEHISQQAPQQYHQPTQQYQQQHVPEADPFNKYLARPRGAPSPASAAGPFKPPPGYPTAAQIFVQPNGSFGLAKPVPPTAAMNATKPLASSPVVPPPPKRKGPTNEQLQYDRMKGKMVVEPIMRDRVARRSNYDSRTIARDILLATGRHPDMRPLNSHLNTMQKLLGDKGGMLDQSGNKSDLATIKWDILDPEPPKRTLAPAPAKERAESKQIAPKQIEPKQTAEPDFGVAHSTEVETEDADADDEEDVRPVTQKEGSAEQARDLPNATANARTTANANNKPPKVPKKRGRPPRQSAPNGSTFTGVNSPMETSSRLTGTPRQASGQPQGAPATAPAGRATSSTAPTGAPTGYAAFRQFDENGNVVKTKGRPKGWRKAVHSREAQGLTPKKSGSSGTNPKPKASPAQLQEPKYQVYACCWSGCKAELHSLEVLKKHVIKVHGRPGVEERFHCQWRGCDESESFEDIADWLAHVDKEHFQPVAWKLGDGPRGGLSG